MGGKTSLLIGLALTEHHKSIIFRREAKQLREIIDQSKDIIGEHGRFNENLLIWRGIPGGKVLEFGGVKDEDDVSKWRGRPHDFCVGKGTPVRMADGSYKPIEEIRVGDSVATLEGSRWVTRTHRIEQKSAVIAHFYRNHLEVGRQIQGADHGILTIGGWVSYDDLLEMYPSPVPSLSTLRHGYGNISLSSERIPLEVLRHPCTQRGGQQSGAGVFQTKQGRRAGLGVYHPVSDADEVNLENDFSGFERQRAESEPLVLSSDLQVPFRPSRELCSLDSVGPSIEHEVCDAEFGLSQLGWQGHCFVGCGQRDEQPHSFQVDALLCPQQLDDVGQPIPMGFEDGVRGQTPKHSPRRFGYVHPYTGEPRQTKMGLVPCTVSFEPIGNLELFDITVDCDSHYITQEYGIVNSNCGFDEVTELTRNQAITLTAWNRTTRKGQRCRIVMAFNPPSTAEGQWVIEYFAPWIDPNYKGKRALPGELRWFAAVEGKDIERPNGESFEYKRGHWTTPKSRTFIPAKLSDNPYLANTNYASTLMALDEIQRRQLLDGDFTTMMHDDAMQVIPSPWVDAAIERWKNGKKPDTKMLTLGVDVSRGGDDKTTYAPRFGNWIDRLIAFPGSEITNGQAVVSRLINIHQAGAVINIDMNSWGSSAYDQLCELDYTVVGTIAQEGCTERDKSGRYGFINCRARDWWNLREMLDPESGEDVCLPDDPELRADLVAPRFFYRRGNIGVELKEEIKKRRGKSTDYGDAVVLAMATGGALPNFRTLG